MRSRPSPDRLGRPITREIALDDIAFDPVGNPSRFAEVCMVVRRPTGDVLLSIKTFYPRGAYRLPTGGIDQDEPILDAVVRETLEETGLTVDVTRFLAALTYRDGPAGPPVFHTFAFLLERSERSAGHAAGRARADRVLHRGPGERPAAGRRSARADPG